MKVRVFLWKVSKKTQIKPIVKTLLIPSYEDLPVDIFSCISMLCTSLTQCLLYNNKIKAVKSVVGFQCIIPLKDNALLYKIEEVQKPKLSGRVEKEDREPECCDICLE